MLKHKETPTFWAFESLEAIPGFEQKKMFGCLAAYIQDRLVLVFAQGPDEPWNGFLLPTDRDFHIELMKKWKTLSQHKILGKWLYLSQSDLLFEEVLADITQCILKNDTRFAPMIGVISKGKKKVRKKPSRRVK